MSETYTESPHCRNVFVGPYAEEKKYWLRGSVEAYVTPNSQHTPRFNLVRTARSAAYRRDYGFSGPGYETDFG